MKHIEQNDIRSLQDYEKLRPEIRRTIIALKQRRRVGVGDAITLVFENRSTVLFQIQEMARIEHIESGPALQLEIDTYNELIPGPAELSATMFIDIHDPEHIYEVLDSFTGLPQGRLCMVVNGRCVAAKFDLDQETETRISAVQYLRFPLGADLAREFCDPATDVSIEVRQPGYLHSVPVTGELRQSLSEDLQT